jgi:hypothetical protein
MAPLGLRSAIALLALLPRGAYASAPLDPPLPYFGRVHDTGIIVPFGDGKCPGNCDYLGARDTFAWVDPFDPQWPYKMTYDGSGPSGWLSSMAVSNDPTLRNWTKRGTVLELGPAGGVDSKSASYLTALYDPTHKQWVGYYLGTNQTSPPPGDVPIAPYYTLLATAPSSAGPWSQRHGVPVFPAGSPGIVIPSPENASEWWQFCTGCGASIGIARTADLYGTWEPFLGLISDPVENTALYYEQSNQLWFLFTNHVGPDAQGMAFDDAIWVYWSDSLTSWPASQKAVVLNRTNVIEPAFQVGRVGLPTLLKVPGNDAQLALIYDGGGTRNDVSYNENCSIALAWLDLPLQPPA